MLPRRLRLTQLTLVICGRFAPFVAVAATTSSRDSTLLFAFTIAVLLPVLVRFAALEQTNVNNQIGTYVQAKQVSKQVITFIY